MKEPDRTIGPIEDGRPRQRKIEAIVTSGIVAVMVLAAIVIITPLHDALPLPKFAPPPPPTATLIPGDNLFFIDTSPYGSVTVDGHLLTKTSSSLFGDSGKLMSLSRGIHQIIWHADPFKPVRCVVSVPTGQYREDCPSEKPFNIRSGPYAGANARLITFNASLADLPDNLRADLLQKAQAALDTTLRSTDTVLPGERYLSGSISQSIVPVIAKQQLYATLHFHLDTDPNSPRSCGQFGDFCKGFNGENCYLFCTSPNFEAALQPLGLNQPHSPADKLWNVYAIAYGSWEYKTASGQIIAQDQPDTDDTANEHSLMLGITWEHNQWHVDVSALAEIPTNQFGGDLACATAVYKTQSSGTYTVTAGSDKLPLDWNFIAGTNRAEGCLGVVVPNQSSTPTPVTHALLPHAALFLYRFGVLLAVNDLAHRYFPSLPVADAYEQSVAQGIAAKVKLQ